MTKRFCQAMTISTDDPRDIKAMAALRDSGQWARVKDGNGTVLAYGVPSATTEGLYHFANATSCLCKDAEYGNRCWHQRAVALHLAMTQPKPRHLHAVARIHHTTWED